jgi:hypothetical protein
MINNLKKLSSVLDDSTLSRRVANAVKHDSVRIQQEITDKGAATVTVGERSFRVVRAPQEVIVKFRRGG